MYSFRIIKYISILLIAFAFSACFTGVENTKKISEKDVNKYVPVKSTKEQTYLDTVRLDNFSNWTVGKSFYVVDNQAKLLFTPSSQYDLDTVRFQGKILSYKGYNEKNILGTQNVVNLIFTDSSGAEYNYTTNKTTKEIVDPEYRLNIPFFISQDMIAIAKDLLVGKELYIKTPLWYISDDELIQGIKFIKVLITNVLPGNKTFPLRVEFFDGGKTSFVFISTIDTHIVNRTFDSVFSFEDIRKQYPLITDENWKLITEGKITSYMTKEECRLSLGAPKKIDQRPTYEGLSEIWNYENGVYLIFQDGILKNYRK